MLQECNFNKGCQRYVVEYFLTLDRIGDTVPPHGEVWLVLSIRESEHQKHYVLKSLSILRQPKEVIDIIVRREALAIMGVSKNHV